MGSGLEPQNLIWASIILWLPVKSGYNKIISSGERQRDVNSVLEEVN